MDSLLLWIPTSQFAFLTLDPHNLGGAKPSPHPTKMGNWLRSGQAKVAFQLTTLIGLGILGDSRQVHKNQGQIHAGTLEGKALSFYQTLDFIYLFIFVSARQLSQVAASGGYSSLWCAGFPMLWLLLLRSMGSRHAGFSSCGAQA